MHDGPAEPVRDGRARGTATGVVGAEHEVVDQQLGAAGEQVGERRGSGLGVEGVVLLDADPGQCLALSGELVAAACGLLLGLAQGEAGGQPLFACSGGHGCLLQMAMIRPRTTIASASGTSIAALGGSS